MNTNKNHARAAASQSHRHFVYTPGLGVVPPAQSFIHTYLYYALTTFGDDRLQKYVHIMQGGTE